MGSQIVSVVRAETDPKAPRGLFLTASPSDKAARQSKKSRGSIV